MSEKINVESGNPYRDQSGHFGTSPDQKLKDSFKALQGKKFLPKGKGGNKELIKGKKKEASKLLSNLRGGNGDGADTSGYAQVGDKVGTHTITGATSWGAAVNEKGMVSYFYEGDLEHSRWSSKDGVEDFTKEEYDYFASHKPDKLPKPEPAPEKNKDFEDSQVSAIEDYTTEANTWLNSDLRAAKGDDSKLDAEDKEEYYDQIDKSMVDTIKEPYIYRGTTFDPGKELKPGVEFTDHAYGSSSKDPEHAITWADPEGDAGSMNQYYANLEKNKTNFKSFVFKIPTKGNKFLDVDGRGLGANDDEKEVLIPRGTKYRVKKVTPKHSEGVDQPYDYSEVELEIIK